MAFNVAMLAFLEFMPIHMPNQINAAKLPSTVSVAAMDTPSVRRKCGAVKPGADAVTVPTALVLVTTLVLVIVTVVELVVVIVDVGVAAVAAAAGLHTPC